MSSASALEGCRLILQACRLGCAQHRGRERGHELLSRDEADLGRSTLTCTDTGSTAAARSSCPPCRGASPDHWPLLCADRSAWTLPCGTSRVKSWVCRSGSCSVVPFARPAPCTAGSVSRLRMRDIYCSALTRLGGDRPSDVLEQAKVRKAQGFTRVKMNVGPQAAISPVVAHA